LKQLVPTLPAVAAHLEGGAAAQGTTALIQAIKDTKDPMAVISLGRVLSEVVARLGPRDAAQAAVTLAGAIRETRYRIAEYWLALNLSTVAARLEARDAARAADTLLQVIRDFGRDVKDPAALFMLVRGLPAVAARMEAEGAATVFLRALGDVRDPAALQNRARGLTPTPPAEVPSRTATAAIAAAFPAGTPANGLTALALLVSAADPPPCILSPQQLVEVLKMPTCVGEVRRVVLDHLGNRYRRPFADAWEFMHFAKEQNLDLDFTSPPQRPEVR
jgi:hypothetical protein